MQGRRVPSTGSAPMLHSGILAHLHHSLPPSWAGMGETGVCSRGGLWRSWIPRLEISQQEPWAGGGWPELLNHSLSSCFCSLSLGVLCKMGVSVFHRLRLLCAVSGALPSPVCRAQLAQLPWVHLLVQQRPLPAGCTCRSLRLGLCSLPPPSGHLRKGSF
jgi:hypothetical protein